MEKILNFIDGKMQAPVAGKFFENVDPSRGKASCLIPDSDESDVDAAVKAAERAFPAWSSTPVSARAALIDKLADLIHRDLDLLAEIESRDNGKPKSLAKSLDIPRSEANFRFFASAIQQFHGESFVLDGQAVSRSEFSPLGVVACISPWNLPLYLLSWKLAPALAAGNCVVAKPSEVTPLTAAHLAKLVIEAGFPAGVLNLVHGLGPRVGEPLVKHPLVKAVSFTGSTATGRRINEAVAGQFKKVSLEMGGKNANIVFADCDFERALETSLRSSFANQGQICLCGSRILVEKPIYEKFRDALVAKAKALKVGDPLDAATDQGALVSKPHLDKVMSFIETAKAEGGKILCGGKRPALAGPLAEGFFLEPTLIEGLPSSSKVNQEEIFGPVATLIPFEGEAEALKIANSTRYGLSASVWTSSGDKAQRMARGLEAGLVWINTWMLRDLRTPFGGVKESGLGREGGMEALKFFSEVKNVCNAWPTEVRS